MESPEVGMKCYPLRQAQSIEAFLIYITACTEVPPMIRETAGFILKELNG